MLFVDRACESGYFVVAEVDAAEIFQAEAHMAKPSLSPFLSLSRSLSAAAYEAPATLKTVTASQS